MTEFSIVTPSFNKARFLAEAMDSVLDQTGVELEYVVVDGGSDDGSRDIIEARAERLAWWVSEPDNGMYHALNKGFERTTGEIMGWLGADDHLLPGALSVVRSVFEAFPEVRWLTSLYPLILDGEGRVVRCAPRRPVCRKNFMKGGNLPGAGWRSDNWMQQESTFWRRSLWEEAGGRLDDSLRYAGDFELWTRFMTLAEPCSVDAPIGAFRRYGAQASADHGRIYRDEAVQALLNHGGIPWGKGEALLVEGARRIGTGRLAPAFKGLNMLRPGLVAEYDSKREIWRLVER